MSWSGSFRAPTRTQQSKQPSPSFGLLIAHPRGGGHPCRRSPEHGPGRVARSMSGGIRGASRLGLASAPPRLPSRSESHKKDERVHIPKPRSGTNPIAFFFNQKHATDDPSQRETRASAVWSGVRAPVRLGFSAQVPRCRHRSGRRAARASRDSGFAARARTKPSYARLSRVPGLHSRSRPRPQTV